MRNLIFGVAICLWAIVPVCPSQETALRTDPKSLLEAYVSAWNRHDSAAFSSLLSPDVVHEDLAYGFRGEGVAQIANFMKAVLEQEPDFAWHLTNVFVSGSSVAGEWTWTATYSGDCPNGPVVHQHIAGRGVSIAIVENGRIKRFTDYYDTASFFPKLPPKAALPSTQK